MYARLELNGYAIDLRQETDNILRLGKGWYKKDCDRRVRFSPIFRIGDFILLARPPLSRSAAESSALKRYNMFFPANKGSTK